MGLNPVLTMTGPSGGRLDRRGAQGDRGPGATGGPGRRGARGPDAAGGAGTVPTALVSCSSRVASSAHAFCVS